MRKRSPLLRAILIGIVLAVALNVLFGQGWAWLSVLATLVIWLLLRREPLTEEQREARKRRYPREYKE